MAISMILREAQYRGSHSKDLLLKERVCSAAPAVEAEPVHPKSCVHVIAICIRNLSSVTSHPLKLFTCYDLLNLPASHVLNFPLPLFADCSPFFSDPLVCGWLLFPFCAVVIGALDCTYATNAVQ